MNKFIAALAMAATALGGCAVDAQNYHGRHYRSNPYSYDYRHYRDHSRREYYRQTRPVPYNTTRAWRGRNGQYYCHRSDGTTGLVVGGIAGALLGRTIDTDGDRSIGTLGGAAAGALAGQAIDRRKCR